MNCFEIDMDKVTKGIPLNGIDGIRLGEQVVVPLDDACLPLLSKVIINGLLCEASFNNGKIVAGDTANQVIVRLRTISSSDKSIASVDFKIEKCGPIELVCSGQYASDYLGTGSYLNWSNNRQLLLAMIENSSVTVTWTIQRKKRGHLWWRQTFPPQVHSTTVYLHQGKPVVTHAWGETAKDISAPSG